MLYLDDQKLKVDAAWAVAYIADDAVGGRQVTICIFEITTDKCLNVK